jgi:hypothetical protein
VTLTLRSSHGLIKTIPKPNSGTPLSYWRPVYFAVYADRIEILVDGFFSVQQREAGSAPDWQGIAVSPLPDAIPGGKVSDVKYAVLKGASLNGVAFADAEDFNEDPWRTPAEAIP